MRRPELPRRRPGRALPGIDAHPGTRPKTGRGGESLRGHVNDAEHSLVMRRVTAGRVLALEGVVAHRGGNRERDRVGRLTRVQWRVRYSQRRYAVELVR